MMPNTCVNAWKEYVCTPKPPRNNANLNDLTAAHLNKRPTAVSLASIDANTVSSLIFAKRAYLIGRYVGSALEVLGIASLNINQVNVTFQQQRRALAPG